MTKFRKKPVVVEGEQWVKDCAWWDVESLLYGVKPVKPERLDPPITVESMCEQCGELMWDHGWVKTLEGGLLVCPGDWIMVGVKGEKYPIKPDVLILTYDRVTSGDPVEVEIEVDEEEGTKIVTVNDLDREERVHPTPADISGLLASGLANPTEKTKMGKDMAYLQRLNNFCNDRCILHSSSDECKACPVMRERKRHMPDFDKL